MLNTRGTRIPEVSQYDLQRRIARQEGERLARRARSHGGFLAIDQSLDDGFEPCFTKITP